MCVCACVRVCVRALANRFRQKNVKNVLSCRQEDFQIQNCRPCSGNMQRLRQILWTLLSVSSGVPLLALTRYLSERRKHTRTQRKNTES